MPGTGHMLLVTVAAAVTAALGPIAGASGAVRLKSVGEFASPTYVAASPGDHKRLFVTERAGTVRLLKKGKLVGRPFLEIPGEVTTDGERGLLSIAFHPRYRKNRYLYAFYTDGAGDLRVDEFRRSRKRPNRALRKSRRSVLRIEHSRFSNHNGGQLQFGPDGLLYVSTGDGGGANDTLGNGQDRDSLLGKLLRVDPRDGKPFGIPEGNPFAAGAGADEVFAYGLRNPYRFSFDRQTGELAIGDVGQSAREEVDFGTIGQLRGANFGWPCFEGSQRTPGVSPCTPPDHEPPVFEYSHSGGRCAITGGYVVRDPRLSGLTGRYVYADFCEGQLRSVRLDRPRATDDRPLGLRVPGLASFGEDAGGCVYAVSLSGPVYKLVDGRAGRRPC